MTKEKIIELLPKLASDKVFKITSPEDDKYNCIAWAGLKDNIWWWPYAFKLDGIDWPFELPRDTNLATFVSLFEKMDYIECETHEFEHHFMKIAIYQNLSTRECTHAARQRVDGVWTSKLGPKNDISHQDPYAVEGPDYGKVVKIMKRSNTSYDIKKIKNFILPGTT